MQQQTNTTVGANPSKIGPKALAPTATQPPALTASLSSSGSCDGSVPASSPTDVVPTIPVSPSDPFVSSIYCSRDCAEKDVGSSTAAANTDSSISVAAALRGAPRTPDALVGTSVPKTIEFFRLPRDLPDDAWRESRTVRPQLEPIVQQHMSRQRSSGPHSASGTSSDSLASLWNGDHEINPKRSSSNVGSLCAMTPMYAPTPDSAGSVSARRSMSSSSDGSGIQRPALPRSTLSHTSLGGLSSPVLNTYHPEVGSAPSHTAYLMQAYASAFPARDGGALSPPALSGSATPDSRSTSVSIAPVPLRSTSGTIRGMRNRQGSTGATWDSFGKAEVRERVRRNTASSEAEIAVGSLPQSPDLDNRRGRINSYCEATPKQSFEVEHGGWQIRYRKPAAEMQRRRNASRSRSRSREPSSRSNVPGSPVPAASNALPLPIPVRARPGPSMLASSTSTARSRTPQTGGTPLASRGSSSIGLAVSPQGSRYGSSAALPDIAAMHIGAAATSLSLAATALSAATATAASATTAAATTAVSREYATSPSPRSLAGSIPRPGFDWEKRSDHRTYELPKGVVQNPNKGLFYFNV